VWSGGEDGPDDPVPPRLLLGWRKVRIVLENASRVPKGGPTLVFVSSALGALAACVFIAVGAACGAAAAGRPNLPPPEYLTWPDADASVPGADADAAVDVARREVHE
jgi:hypothetical protein